MQNVPLWKPLLIAAVLGLCGLSLYPPSQRLKPGLDLAGGTTLVYQVQVPDDQDPRTVIDQTIASLRKRVDPNGVRNLAWRRQAGNRIEIQVPLAPAQTSERRAKYLRLRDELLSANLRVQDVDFALQANDNDKVAALSKLAGDDGQRRQLLDQLAQADDELAAATGLYQQAQLMIEQAQKALDSLDPAAPDEERQAKQQALDAAVHASIRPTDAYIEASDRLGETKQAVLGSNIDPDHLEHVLGLPQVASETDADQGENPRLATMEGLILAHPDRGELIRGVFDSHEQYAQVKGPFDDPNDLIVLLRGSGVLEFRIAPAPEDVPEQQTYLDKLRTRGPRAGFDEPYRWFVIDDLAQFVDSRRQRVAMEENPQAYFENRGLIGLRYTDEYYVLLANTVDQSISADQDEWELSRAGPTVDDRGLPAVRFALNRVGGQLMGSLTGSNRGKPMAIVLDGRVISTPTIQAQIQDQGIITGGRSGFGQQELEYLIRTLNAGTLQGRLSESPISIKKFGPQLGQDNLHHGLKAAVWALVLVAGFMAIYYFFMGLVADLALAANMVIILGVMAMLDATFTLPGIAGIVLTIGMAVDANVLIFERIREEMQGEGDLTKAVRLGYQKALSTIIDANVTTLITCVILNYTATAEIKGFAVTLMTGILATMFTALFCTRVLVEWYMGVAKPKKLSMLPTRVRAVRRLLSPKFDWIGRRYIFLGISAVLMVLGVSVVAMRGADLLDIEFRSGTQVGFHLAKGKTLALQDVRDRLTKTADSMGLPHLRGDHATVVTVGQTEGSQASEFSISTLETDAAAVSHAIKSGFADVLDVQQPVGFAGMDYGDKVNPLIIKVVHSATLGDNIGRPELREDVTDYLGKVAVVLEDLTPAQTVEGLTDRIKRMQMQPAFEGLGYRSFKVIGLDLDPSSDSEEPKYQSAVVVSGDANTYYAKDDLGFAQQGGLAQTQWTLVRDALQRDTSLSNVSNFSSQVSNTMKQQALVAMILSLLGVVAYIWIRFGSLRYGLAAIVALVHDVSIALGLLALSGWVFQSAVGQLLGLGNFKINLAQIAAVLTIVGYSLNDTIVVFDRIRENRGRLATATPGIINDSINQTISRTVMTSLTTLLALFTLYVYGGDGVHGFAFTMLVGVLVGTYSSIAIASPILLLNQAVGGSDNPAATGAVSTAGG